MGANAQTTVPTFTAGQILTADQQNQSARTGVPVFATTATRDAAFGGTGEKTLAQGQLCYLEATDVVQYYNGTAWATLAPAAAGALTLISATTIGSAVSTVTVSSAFSSTYDNYLITISGGVASTTNELLLQLGGTTTNYTRTGFFVTLGSATLTGFTGTDWRIGGGSTDNLMANVNLFGPNLTKRTTAVANIVQPVTSGAAQTSFLLLNDTTSYTAFTISTNSGTITGGTIRVYGYANS
jgi:hypothetical protein